MKSLLLCLLLSLVTALETRAESEREFFSGLIDSLPKATPGQFKTPDSVARYFVQRVIDNQIQDTFRCIPLSRMYAVYTFENGVRYVGNTFSPNKDTLPDDDYGRYLRLLDGYHSMPVQKCRLALLLASNPSVTNLLGEVQQPQSTDSSDISKWLGKLS